MKFDDRYEHIQLGFRDNTIRIVRGITKAKCSQCKKKTYWIHYDKKNPNYMAGHKYSRNICSEECLEKFKNATMSN